MNGYRSVTLYLQTRGYRGEAIKCILSHGRHVVAEAVDCWPGQGPTVKRGEQTLLNSYRPPTLVPKPGEWPSIAHVLTALTGDDPAGVEWLLNWIAAKVQNPALRPQTAVVLHGAQGTGKGTLGQIIPRILGEDNCVAISQDDLDSQFNSTYVDKLFVEADEVFTKDSIFDRSGYLKHLITDPRVVVNHKHVAGYEVNNVMAWLFTSNVTTPVRLEGSGDRRFTVFSSTGAVTGEYRAFLRSLFGPDGQFTSQMEAEVAGFAQALLERKIDLAALSYPYLNRARTELAEASKSPAELFFDEIDAQGIESILGNWNGTGWDFGEEGVLQSAVYRAYRDCALAGGYTHPVSLGAFTKEMSQRRPRWRKVRSARGKTRPYLYQGLPRLPLEPALEKAAGDAGSAKT